MDEVFDTKVDYRAIFSRRWLMGLGTSAVLLVITLALALGLPSYFKSRAVILIEAQEMPQDLVRSLVTSFADERIQIISQRVLTNSNLSAIIEKYDLYTDQREHEPLEVVLDKMRKEITVTPINADVADPRSAKTTQATIAFELSYESRSPMLAQRVANEVVSLFLSENLRQREETSQEALTFLTSELDKLRAQVLQQEEMLSKFKEKHVTQLPEINSLNIELMNRTENDIRALETEIRSLEQQRVYLESELAQQKPVMGLFAETGERILGPADRLKVLESEFAPLAARYGAAHPDVVGKRKEIESLRTQVGEGQSADELSLKLTASRVSLAEIKRKYAIGHPDVKRLEREVAAIEDQLKKVHAAPQSYPSHGKPDNPAYIQLQSRLQGTQTEIAGLAAQKSALAAKLIDLEKRVSSSPDVERQYRALTRDLETSQAKYQEISAKRQEAEVASNLESEKKGERFTLIEPPVTPEEPSKPNRLAIMILGFVFAVGGGIGAAALAESMDDRIYGRYGIVKILGVPPLAVIPLMDTSVSLKERLAKRIYFLLGVVLVISLAALAIHLAYKPLDVLFFQLLRFVGP